MSTPKLYDYLDEIISINNIKPFDNAELDYYASDLMQELGYESEEDLRCSLHRAFEICNTLNIPFKKNFKKIYRNNGAEWNADWQLSQLACYLLIVNGNPCNPMVAKAQLTIAIHVTH